MNDLDALAAQLQRVPEMQGARPESLKLLSTAGELVEHPAGAEVYRAGSSSRDVLVLLRGSIHLLRKSVRGELTLLETRTAPALVGEAAALDGGPRMVTAMAEDAIQFFRIPSDRWRECVRKDAALGMGLANRLARVLRQGLAPEGATEPQARFSEVILRVIHDDVPDNSLVRILAQLPQGGMAHFELGPGQISVPQRHRTISEIWYILSGLGIMWRYQDGDAAREIDLRPGVSLTIPVGTSFQFKNTCRVPLAAIGVTIPPWPGGDEAFEVTGPWST